MNCTVNRAMVSLLCVSLSTVMGVSANNGYDTVSDTNTNMVCSAVSSNGNITFEITLDEFDTIPVLIDNERYYQIYAPEFHSPLMKGDPDLPVITKSFIIPENSDYTVRVIEERFTDQICICV